MSAEPNEVADFALLAPDERTEWLKEMYRREQDRLMALHHEEHLGLQVSAGRSELMDGILRQLFQAALESPLSSTMKEVTLVATGGYGRGLLNFGSDIDLLLLVKGGDQKTFKPLIEALFYPLWDLGLTVGHAVRTVRECQAIAREDPVTCTALLDARYLAGNEGTFSQWYQKFKEEVRHKYLERFLAERERDLADRLQRANKTIYLQEPHMKESPGALRDFHNLLWLADVNWASRDLDELAQRKIISPLGSDELRQAHEFMHLLRNDLHLYTGRASDILTLRHQGVIADNLPYGQGTHLRRIEALMKDYYLHARHIHQQTWTILEVAQLELQSRRSGLSKLFSSEPRAISHGAFFAQGDHLHPKDLNVLTEKPTRILRAFQLCQKYQLTPSPQLRRILRRHNHLIDHAYRNLKAHREIFQNILEQKGRVSKPLRLMHDLGILGRYLPEFSLLDCLVQHEFFHRYTADEHTLRTLDELDDLLGQPRPETEIYRNFLIQMEDPYALHLALLLHDTGRAENIREHTDGSAILAARACKRLKITGPTRRLIMFLVDHHLTFWSFATKRNIEDPTVVAEFARIVKDHDRLDALLLFTYADSKGTNEESWSSWKETLMLQLYRATSEYLDRGHDELELHYQKALAKTRKALIKKFPESRHSLVSEHFDAMPVRYFRYRKSSSIQRHIRAILQYYDRRSRRPHTPFEAAFQWDARPNQGYTELIIVTANQPFILEKISCALATHQLNIRSADIYTRSDGLVLDLLRVCTHSEQAVKDPIHQMSVVTTLYELCQATDYDPARYLKRKKNYLDTSAPHPFDIPVRALINNEAHPIYSQLEIQAVDRIGLLHDILRLLNQHRIEIITARIATEKGAALDTFHLKKDGEKILDDSLQEDITRALYPLLQPASDQPE